MPKNIYENSNKIVFDNCINILEGEAKIALIDKEQFATALRDAWEKDKSTAKVEFLGTYGKIFRSTLEKWTIHEAEAAFQSRSDTMPNFGKNLLCVEQNLKLSAMALIPELRENKDVLSNMTFGGVQPNALNKEFTSVTRQFTLPKKIEKAVAEREQQAYKTYADKWANLTVRRITEVAYSEEKLASMSRDEKINYRLALGVYLSKMSGKKEVVDNKEVVVGQKIGDKEIDLIESAIAVFNTDLKWYKNSSIVDNLGDEYSRQASKIHDQDRIYREVQQTITAYNQSPNPAADEITKYKLLHEDAQKVKADKERTIENSFEDEAVSAVGDLFAIAEAEAELNDVYTSKERTFLNQKVDRFNETYKMRIGQEKFRTSIDQVSRLMMSAREEKERFLDPENVVVIENGKERVVRAEEYFATEIAEVEKQYQDSLSALEGKERSADLERQKKEIEKEHKTGLARLHGGIVIEKNGDVATRFVASDYFDTHETTHEQYAYSEYQKMYGRIFADACRSVKEENYAKGTPVNYGEVAKDVDEMFKSAMFESRMYDNAKNEEMVEKCNFGGFSTEQLANIAVGVKDEKWSLNQKSEQAWQQQSDMAKKILSDWHQAEKQKGAQSSTFNVQKDLLTKSQAFKNGEIGKKELLDYTLAAESHLQRNFNGRWKKLFNFIQYRNEMAAIRGCRSMLGLNEKASLRAELSNIYAASASQMQKENVFQAMDEVVGNSLSFDTAKEKFETEHKQVKDAVKEQKQAAFNDLMESGREPLVIEELDERKAILHQGPRVKPIGGQVQLMQNRNLQQVQ